MSTETSKIDSYLDQEQPTAERYKWWGVYLIREKRRLQGIAEAVQAGEAAEESVLPELAIPDGVETPEELLTRVDAELDLADAESELETPQADEADTHPYPVVTAESEEAAVEEAAEEDADTLRRKLRGKAALLGKQQAEAKDKEEN